MESNNQNPLFYSDEYYLSACAGAHDFIPGQDSKHSIFNYVLKIAGPLENKHILDLGCGRGELCLACLRRGASKAVGIDFSESAIKISQDNLNASSDIDKDKVSFILGDALSCEFEDKFDVIFLTDIVEHLHPAQNQTLFARLKKLLTPQGKIVIHTMPTREFIEIGQYFKAAYYLLKLKKYSFLTYESQREITHVNLQSKRTLSPLLENFNHQIWYDFSTNSWWKNLLSKIKLTKYFSSNLWAIATHKSSTGKL